MPGAGAEHEDQVTRRNAYLKQLGGKGLLAGGNISHVLERGHKPAAGQANASVGADGKQDPRDEARDKQRERPAWKHGRGRDPGLDAVGIQGSSKEKRRGAVEARGLGRRGIDTFVSHAIFYSSDED